VRNEPHHKDFKSPSRERETIRDSVSCNETLTDGQRIKWMSVESKVKNYMLENFLFTNDPNALANDDSFIRKGLIDSTGVLEIIAFIEDEFGIAVDDAEMVADNLDSVNNIVKFVMRKKNG
jgi:acyl carrier protein